MESGEVLSDELMREVTQLLQDYIRDLQAAPPSAVEPPIGELPTQELPGAPHPSSNINAFQYDPKSGRLLVKFMGKDVADAGPTYSYSGVPEYIFDIFKRGAVAPKTSGKNKWHTWRRGVTPSHGAAMYALIKAGKFPYQRLS